MFAPFPKAKRARSPSPNDFADLASPLDMLAKRRRREAAFDQVKYPFPGSYAYPTPPAESADTFSEAESSTAWLSRPSINGRRSRQWQHQNAPSSSQGIPSASQVIPSITTNSQPPPQANFDAAHGSSPWSMEHGRVHSQPELSVGRHFGMSSSPIRHQAPGSSPFRASGGMAGMKGLETPLSEPPRMGEEEGWGDDELGQEWGEYARENLVLYSIHKNRSTSFATPPHPNNIPIMTPIRQQQTQQAHISRSYSASYREQPPSSGSTQFPQSSPFGGLAASDTTHIDFDDGEEDSSMEVLDDWPLSSQEAETRRRYEDANRLLAELAVARRRRWGET